jgi:hypothetical protein
MGNKPMERRGPFQLTNSSKDTYAEAKIALGPSVGINVDFIHLLRDISLMLYGYVAAARTLPNRSDKTRHAVEQVQFSSAALAAAEAEAIATMVSFGLCGPARVHVRTLGEIARRCSLIAVKPDLGAQFYDSLEPSRRQLADSVPANHFVKPMLAEIFGDAAGPSMEKIERAAADEFADLDRYAYIISAYERKDYSKWAHGDIVALADVADRVQAAGKEINNAICRDRFPEMMLHRSAQFGLLILSVLSDHGIGTRAEVEDLNARCEALAPIVRDYLERLKAAVEQALRTE